MVSFESESDLGILIQSLTLDPLHHPSHFVTDRPEQNNLRYRDFYREISCKLGLSEENKFIRFVTCDTKKRKM
jgi:hypothetical protein